MSPPRTRSRTRAGTRAASFPPSSKKSQRDDGHYEFFGPTLGPLGVMLGLPLTIVVLCLWCQSEPLERLGTEAFFSLRAAAVFLLFVGFQVVLHLVLPGEVVQGVAPHNLRYKLTGLKNFLVTVTIAVYCGFFAPAQYSINLSYLYDAYVPLMTSSVIFSTMLSVYLYRRSFRAGAVLAEEGSRTGRRVYEFFLGRELNPRLGGLDLKEFCELYPGLIGWVVLNLGMAHKQFQLTGAVSPSMVLVNVFQAIYVLDSLVFERAILTTMDITTDGFGFMLAFGDLAWVPFTYSLQTRVLVTDSPSLPTMALVAIIALKLLGYAMFRGSNSQKDIFRRNPKDPRVQHLRTLATKRGTKLIVSGWWGISRHINYFGDWLMGLAWCLPCGIERGVLPYFYAAYFAILLIHRELRDEESCRKKYGRDYDRYCELVPYRIVPGLY